MVRSQYNPVQVLRKLALLAGFCLVHSATFSQDTTRLPFDRYRAGDIIANRHFFLKGYPDTLFMGAFRIVVEEYDKGGSWNAITKSYIHLNGIGRIKFSCQNMYPWNVFWKDAIMKAVSVKVVDSVTEANNEISTRDAALLGIKAKVGTNVNLMLPHYGNKAIDLSRYLTDVAALKKPDGIRVRFTDLTVKVSKQGATSGLVTTGVANYPTDPEVPPVPINLHVYPGFVLQISSIILKPFQNALINARLLLPSSVTANNDCQNAGLNLGDLFITQKCEFYKFLPDSAYGVFGIGNTTLSINGRGYVVDFSSTKTYPVSGKPTSWKGVVLIQGKSNGSPADSVISNIGYLQAPYSFTNAFVESDGLKAKFYHNGTYRFNTTQPFGYSIEMENALVNVSGSRVSGGLITGGKVILPRTAVRQANDATVVVTDLNLAITPIMDISGSANYSTGGSLYWGDFIKAGGGERKSFGLENVNKKVLLYFAASPRPLFQPVTFTGKKFNNPFTVLSNAALNSFGIQGATFSGFDILVVNTTDRPKPPPFKPNSPQIPGPSNPVWYRLRPTGVNWLNVVTEGVHCNISGLIAESPDIKLGDPSKPLYVGITAFQTLTKYTDSTKKTIFSSILLQCVESAVITCNLSSAVSEPLPTNTILPFKEMVFTSTADNAGGKVVVGNNTSLSYWGLQIVPKPGFTSAGLISVKTGQIILTAAGLEEKRHFAQPFWLTWGEVLANGAVGRLFFDYNSAGQQFDHFNYLHNAVALSPYVPADKGYLRVGGTAFFPFFGGDYLHIKDFYEPALSPDPFNNRRIELSNETLTGFSPSDTTINGNWSDGLGIFDFTIKYADASQDGFLGNGTSLLKNLLGGSLGSTLDMNSRGTCIRIGSNLMDQRSISLGPVANISHIGRIWGCACIKGDGIENLVVGGEVTDAANVSIAARAGSYLSAILQITPSLSRLTLDGEAYMSIAASLDALVSGHMQLTLNHAEGFLEGEVQGKFRVAEGAVLVGSSLEAEGQLNWHLGIDFNELQGMVELKVMKTGETGAVGAGFYIGQNAPKSRAWVLAGDDPRYSLNMTVMPTNLTGIYGTVHVHQGVNLWVISGDYDIYIGFGAFVLPAPIPGSISPGVGLPYIVGNLGGRIHGDIVGGLVSAGAYFNLQLIGPYPFSFQGTVGLEGCVVWVACGSVDLTIGLNSDEGFYIR
jgi:hypothetical protein